MRGSAFIFVLACLSLSAAAFAAERSVPPLPALPYASFRDIPGVTPEEIAAVTALQRSGKKFLHGGLTSTELFRGADGNPHGFTALLCEWLTQLFDIPFTTRLYDWDDMINGLAAEDIDFTGELTATPERRKSYLMTDAIAERLVKKFSLPDSPDLIEITATRPPRFGFLEGVTTADEVRLRTGGHIEAVFVGDYPEAYRLLRERKIDAFIEESTAEAAFDAYADVVAEDFYPLIYAPVSLATRNPANAPIISVVQKALQSGGMRHLTELYNRGLAEYTRHKLSVRLTEEEKAYIRSAPIIKFAAEHDNYPVSFYNEYDNEFQGAFHDALREVAELTGLRFRQVNGPGDDWSALLGMLEQGDASLISELVRSPEREGRFLWPEASFLVDYYALLSKTDTPDVNINEILYMKVGLVEGYAHTDIFHSWFPNHADTRTYGSFNAAFDALARDEIDMVMGSQFQLLTQTNFRELPGYKANIVFDYPFDSTIGFHRGEETLRSIVDKALRLVPVGEIAGTWTRRTYDYRVKVAQSRLPWLAGAVLSLSAVLALLIVLFHRSKREVERMTRFQNVIMETMAELVEYRDGNTGDHIGRTSRDLELMLDELTARGLYPEETSTWNIRHMVLSAQLHDLGKVAIPDVILQKPGELTSEEIGVMRRHTLVGGEIIEKIQRKSQDSDFLEYARVFAKYHHERWDGTGYPDGLRSTEIPLAARLLAIIDVYDALVSERPYKKAFPREEALRIIKEGRGAHFDPVLTDLFLDVAKSKSIPASASAPAPAIPAAGLY